MSETSGRSDVAANPTGVIHPQNATRLAEAGLSRPQRVKWDTGKADRPVGRQIGCNGGDQ